LILRIIGPSLGLRIFASYLEGYEAY